MAVECTKIITEADQTFCVGAQVNLNKSINGVRWVCGWINWTSEVLNIHPRTKGLSRASLINSARHECTRDVLSADCPTLSNTDSPRTVRWIYAESILNTSLKCIHIILYNIGQPGGGDNWLMHQSYPSTSQSEHNLLACRRLTHCCPDHSVQTQDMTPTSVNYQV